ncbi:MAG TPA: hypothetical protein VFW78_09105 [Bacteroidia bacterium]|nr:hypothetical protein [Bacteroidia bacterium]
MRNTIKLRIFLASLVLLFIISCKKDAGSGGNSSIKGYIHVKDYDAFLITLQGEYDGADEDVYIIYGDDISYADRVKSGPDGVFEFKYLRKGNYKVYVYSADTSLAGKVAVLKDVTISAKNQTVDAGTFEIKKR